MENLQGGAAGRFQSMSRSDLTVTFGSAPPASPSVGGRGAGAARPEPGLSGHLLSRQVSDLVLYMVAIYNGGWPP